MANSAQYRLYSCKPESGSDPRERAGFLPWGTAVAAKLATETNTVHNIIILPTARLAKAPRGTGDSWHGIRARIAVHLLLNGLPLTHEQIAQMIGASRETVTRLFADFKKKQVLQIMRRRASVLTRRNFGLSNSVILTTHDLSLNICFQVYQDQGMARWPVICMIWMR